MKMYLKILFFFFIILGVGVGVVCYKKDTSSSFLMGYEMNQINHLKVLFFEDQTLPYIRYSFLSLKGGVDFSPIEKSGISALTGYLLDQGAGGLSSEAIQEQLNYYGTSLDVDVNRQNAELSLSGLNKHALPLLDLFLKIILKPHFDSKEMEILRKQLVESRLKLLDKPDSVASEIFREKLFLDSPLGQGDGGTLSSLKFISLKDVKQFYQEHYIKSPAVFMVVGKFTPELKKQITDQLNASFKDSASQPLSLTSHQSQNSQSSFDFITKEDLIQSQILIGHLIPAYPKENSREHTALKLGVSALGGGQLSSRLNKRVREDLGLTYGIYASVSSGRSYGLFTINGATQTGTTVQFIKETLKIVNRFTEQGISEEELETAKNLSRGYFARQMETKESVADSFFYYHHYLGLKEGFLDQYLKIMESISLEEVQKAVQKYIHPEQLQFLVYGNPTIKEDLKQIKPIINVQSFKERFAKELSF